MKKLVSVMLVLCMVLALVPAMAFAAAGVAQVDDKYFDSLKDAIAYAGVDGHSKRVDIKADNTIQGLQLIIDKDIELQLNGYRVNAQLIVESKATLTVAGDGTVGNGTSSYDVTTIYNHGTVVVKGAKVLGTVVNFGTMTFDVIKTEGGSTYSPAVDGSIMNGDEDHTGAKLTIKNGTFTLMGTASALITNVASTVDVTTGAFVGSLLFLNFGSVTLNEGTYEGQLHYSDLPNGDIAPVVNGGVYTDVDAALHATKPVAGMHFTSSDMYKFYMVSEGTASWFIKLRVKQKDNPIYVDFLYGDMNMSSMPKASDGVTYYNMWKSNYDAWGEKVYGTSNVPGLKGTKLDGRGLVNGKSDFTIVAKKIDGIVASDPIANGVLMTNQKCVKEIKSTYDLTNANEVWFNVTVSVDVDKLVAHPSAEKVYGNMIGNHKWVPIAIGFENLNGAEALTNVLQFANWNNAFTTASGNYVKIDGTNYIGLWIGADHNGIGDNGGFEFVDKETGIIYHVNVKIVDADAGLKDPSEPDDKDNAETYPGDGKDKPATTTAPAATTAPAGTGAGDGPARTGDNSTVMLWATLLIASAAGVAICVVDEAKKRSHK